VPSTTGGTTTPSAGCEKYTTESDCEHNQCQDGSGLKCDWQVDCCISRTVNSVGIDCSDYDELGQDRCDNVRGNNQTLACVWICVNGITRGHCTCEDPCERMTTAADCTATKCNANNNVCEWDEPTRQCSCPVSAGVALAASSLLIFLMIAILLMNI
jgi:hypothetical protein